MASSVLNTRRGALPCQACSWELGVGRKREIRGRVCSGCPRHLPGPPAPPVSRPAPASPGPGTKPQPCLPSSPFSLLCPSCNRCQTQSGPPGRNSSLVKAVKTLPRSPRPRSRVQTRGPPSPLTLGTHSAPGKRSGFPEQPHDSPGLCICFCQLLLLEAQPPSLPVGNFHILQGPDVALSGLPSTLSHPTTPTPDTHQHWSLFSVRTSHKH